MIKDFFIHFILGIMMAIILSSLEWKQGLGIWISIHSLYTIYNNKYYEHNSGKAALDSLASVIGYILYSYPLKN